MSQKFCQRNPKLTNKQANKQKWKNTPKTKFKKTKTQKENKPKKNKTQRKSTKQKTQPTNQPRPTPRDYHRYRERSIFCKMRFIYFPSIASKA